MIRVWLPLRALVLGLLTLALAHVAAPCASAQPIPTDDPALLRELAERLEEARRDDAEARTATAQARFTAWLVAALPAGAGVLAELAAPGTLASLAQAPLTAVLATVSIVLQAIAVLAVRRIAR